MISDRIAVAATKAVLAEIRNPTPAMIAAAAAKAETNGSGDFVAIWQAMLDAIDLEPEFVRIERLT